MASPFRRDIVLLCLVVSARAGGSHGSGRRGHRGLAAPRVSIRTMRPFAMVEVDDEAVDEVRHSNSPAYFACARHLGAAVDTRCRRHRCRFLMGVRLSPDLLSDCDCGRAASAACVSGGRWRDARKIDLEVVVRDPFASRSSRSAALRSFRQSPFATQHASASGCARACARRRRAPGGLLDRLAFESRAAATETSANA